MPFLRSFRDAGESIPMMSDLANREDSRYDLAA